MVQKVAIYCRLSEEDKNKAFKGDDSESIKNQKLMLSQYAFDQGWEVYQIYSDDDFTGSDRKRPEFNRLLKDAEARKFNIVLCKTQSRFTRELEMVEHYIHYQFPLWGIRFVSIVDNADTDNKGNKKSRQINGLVNEWYLEDMSENIKAVLTNRRKNGFHIGAFALYGYKKDPDSKGHLIIDEEAAAVVREVFALFAQGYGKTTIARMLNDRGIPNPTEYKRLHGLRYKQPKNRNSTLWKYYAISNMLTNEIYIGNMVQGKYGSISYKTKQNKPRSREQWYIVENTHEPIIDRELWNKVQSLIAQKTKPFITGQVGIFAQKVHCANCGYTMRSSKSRGRHYLKCPTQHYAKDACEGSFIPVDRLEQIVLEELRHLAEEYLDKSELEQNIEISNNLQQRQQQIRSEIAVYRKKVDEYSKGIHELYLDKVKGLINANDYAEMSKDFTTERENYEHKIADREKRLEEINTQVSQGNDRHDIIEKYSKFDHLDRAMIDSLIDYISVGRRIKGTKDYTVEIHWNF